MIYPANGNHENLARSRLSDSGGVGMRTSEENRPRLTFFAGSHSLTSTFVSLEQANENLSKNDNFINFTI